MAKKNPMTQPNDSTNSIVELSDEDLQQIVGGENEDFVFTIRDIGVVEVNYDDNDSQSFFSISVRAVAISG